jgi:aquaporin NIP
LIAEVLGTFFMIFAGCGSVVVNLNYEKVVTFPGIAITWGLVVMVLVYSVGHISGAHFNPAVTIAFATCKRFPWKQVNYTRETFSYMLVCTAGNCIHYVFSNHSQ